MIFIFVAPGELGIEPKALNMNHSTTELHPSPVGLGFFNAKTWKSAEIPVLCDSREIHLRIHPLCLKTWPPVFHLSFLSKGFMSEVVAGGQWYVSCLPDS
jgi:hypothetical protein